MFFTFDKKTKKISLYEETTLSEHNILERQDIEKWIEDYPDVLGEELLIVSTEYDRFDKTRERLDLLAIDRDGNLVVIELKRDDSGKTVELQAIKYAAYCSTLTLNNVVKEFQAYSAKNGRVMDEEKAKATILEFIANDDFEEINDRPRIILVSKEFRPEVTASVMWLRTFGLDISCVKLTPYTIDDNTIGFESTTIIPLPEAIDFIIRAEEKDNKAKTLTRTQEEYLAFYTDLIKRFDKVMPDLRIKPSFYSYCKVPAGLVGAHFEWQFVGRPRSAFHVALHFESAKKDYNLKMINKLAELKPKLEEATGEELIIQKDWGKAWARMYIEKPEGKMTEEVKEWAIDKMKIFMEILEPEFEKIK